MMSTSWARILGFVVVGSGCAGELGGPGSSGGADATVLADGRILGSDGAPLPTSDAYLTVTERGDSPNRTIAIESVGAYRAVVHQNSGGGIGELYDLVSDPGATKNVAWWERGLFEIGWHGSCQDGSCEGTTRDWPSDPMWRVPLQAEANLEILEQTSARVRIRVDTEMTWWGYVRDTSMPITVVYTFYPAGQLLVQVHLRRSDGAFTWSAEYGPHLAVAASPIDPLLNSHFVFSTPTMATIRDGFDLRPVEALVHVASAEVPTTLFLTIPSASQSRFSGIFRHDGRSVRWDRAGYGSNRLTMAAGYDDTWAAYIQVSSTPSPALATMRSAGEALPYAEQYRSPIDVDGATAVTDDEGDFDHDGFNESDGSTVVRGPGPLSLTYDCGGSACFAPVLKVLDWQGEAPEAVTVNGQAHPASSAVNGSTLVVQLQGHLPATGTVTIAAP